MSLFINREAELRALSKLYRAPGAQFVVVWGRRRIGKTELLKQFVKDRPNYIYLAKVLPTKLQVEHFLREFCEGLGEAVPAIGEWKGAFSFVLQKLGAKKKVIVIDEFPYAIQGDVTTLSYFQDLWDNYLSKRQDVMLVLLGSSISMMESYVLGYKSPLYGRRTGQLKLEKLGLRHVRQFFPKWTFADVIVAYSILDGIPAYLLKFDQAQSIWNNIANNFLDFSQFLFQEPQILIKEELREPISYLRILEAIANMNFRVIDIANAVQIPAYNLPKYLKVLEELAFIEKITPVTAKKPKIKETLYKFKDNYFNFYLRYIFPHLTDINRGRKEFVLSLIKKDIDYYIGRFVFEKICLEALSLKPLFKWQRAGAWWRKGKEIDIVAFNDATKKILFVECKWQERANAKQILAELKAKAQYVPWHNTERKEYYAIFAKSFKKKVREPRVALFELKDLERIIK